MVSGVQGVRGGVQGDGEKSKIRVGLRSEQTNMEVRHEAGKTTSTLLASPDRREREKSSKMRGFQGCGAPRGAQVGCWGPGGSREGPKVHQS